MRAGAEAYEFALASARGWDQELGSVRPSVHAKLVTCDGRICAVGSANLDITACYWESEALLVIEDPATTSAIDEEIGRLIAGSFRIDPHDPEWQRDAQRRVWLGRHWPSTLG